MSNGHIFSTFNVEMSQPGHASTVCASWRGIDGSVVMWEAPLLGKVDLVSLAMQKGLHCGSESDIENDAAPSKFLLGTYAVAKRSRGPDKVSCKDERNLEIFFPSLHFSSPFTAHLPIQKSCCSH